MAPSLSTCEENPFNPEIDRHLKWGPFRIRPFVTIMDTGYDSNIYRRRTNVKSDFTSTLSPGFDFFTYLGSRGKILLKERVDFVLFARENSQNHINNISSAEMNLFFNRFSFTTKGGISYLKEMPNNEIDIRVRSAVNNLQLSSTYKHSSKTGMTLSFSRIAVRYKSDNEFFGSYLSDSLNRNEDSISLSFSQKMLSKTTIIIESTYTQYDFQNDSFERDAEAKYYKLGFKFDPSASISGKFRAGYASFTPKDKNLNTYKGPIGDASLSFRITPSTKTSLNYSKEIVFSIYGENLYYIQNSYGISIFQYLTKRFGLEVGGTLFKSRYTIPEIIPLEDGGTIFDIRKDDVKTGYVGFKYRISEKYNIGLRASRWKRESNVFTENVKQTIIGTNFGYQF